MPRAAFSILNCIFSCTECLCLKAVCWTPETLISMELVIMSVCVRNFGCSIIWTLYLPLPWSATFLTVSPKCRSLLSKLFFFFFCYLLYQTGSLIWWHVNSITRFCSRAAAEYVSILHKGLCYYTCSWQSHFFPPQPLQQGSNGDESLYRK